MKYPIGIQIFSQIRENRSVYVDKTDFIYQLVGRGSIYFSAVRAVSAKVV